MRHGRQSLGEKIIMRRHLPSLSRKAYLVREQAEGTATIRVRVPKAGRYLVLVRYEAAYRFETQFRVKVEQNGKAALDRLYGARKNLKIWAFSQKLKAEHAWSWGASENIVWEGHNAYANLKPGIATITLTTGKQPAPAAKRNIDCLLLTTDEEQVKMRIDKERYLPLDGSSRRLAMCCKGDHPQCRADLADWRHRRRHLAAAFAVLGALRTGRR